MSVIRRTGTYGEYFGSTLDSSSPLSTSEMELNANYIYSYLSNKGWTKNAIAGLLGNQQAESSINPGRWQSDIVGALSMGYGLCQWTPATKYTEWAQSNGFNDYSEMDSNLARIVYEVENNLQWISTSLYPMSFEEFTHSTLSPYELGKAFLLNYERPADQSASVQSYRGLLANTWYEFLDGEPINPSGNTKKKKYKFILFNKRRRVF